MLISKLFVLFNFAGINLRTKQRGIFPTAYAMDLSLLSDGKREANIYLIHLVSL